MGIRSGGPVISNVIPYVPSARNQEFYENFCNNTGVVWMLFPGHNVTAATSSIPSKYQTIVTNNSDRRGFQSRTRRFPDDDRIVSKHFIMSAIYLIKFLKYTTLKFYLGA